MDMKEQDQNETKYYNKKNPIIKETMKVHCEICNVDVKYFKVHEKSNKHQRNINNLLLNPNYFEPKKPHCEYCNINVFNLKIHKKSFKHLKKICTFKGCKDGMNNKMFKQYQYNEIKPIDPKKFIEDMSTEIKSKIESQDWKNLKAALSIQVEFYKELPHEIKKTTGWFNSGEMIRITNDSEIQNILNQMINIIVEKIDNYTCEGSGWIINKLLDFEIKLVEYKPLKASSYIQLPLKYQNPKFRLINIQNKDNECFKWCIARSDCLDENHPHRISKRVKHESLKYNWKGIEFPTELKHISKFENNNNISVNVYGLDEKLEIYPLRITKLKKDKHVDLLLISHDENNHYVLMKELSPFINKTHNGKSFTCSYCLHSFSKKELLDNHEPNCMIHSPVRMELADGPVEFRNYYKQIKHPFVIYADFECTLKKIHTTKPDPTDSYTINLQEHIPNSFCCYTKCDEKDEHSKLEIYEGSDSPKKFADYLISEINRIYKLMKWNEDMIMSEKDKLNYKNAEICFVCEKPFTKENYKVRDHNHLTGEFRGSAHTK
ncbi:unnamed protein product, partial [Rotaria magnacalcarata]